MARRFTLMLGAIALAAALAGPGAVFTSEPAAAQQAQPKKKGLKGSIGYGYRKPYSYSKQDVVGADNKRFYDPGKTRQTPGGPFDNGFFFDSAIGRNGGEAPYMQ